MSDALADADAPARAPRARMVVILVTDLVGSTSTVERLGDAAAQQLVRAHNAMLRAVLREHAGVELQHTGDGIMAYFASAPGSVTCAVAIQRVLARHNRREPDRPLHVRIGLHAGEPLPEEDRLFGKAVIAAHRICRAAGREQILVSDAVRILLPEGERALAGRSERKLKGFAEPFVLFDLAWEETAAS